MSQDPLVRKIAALKRAGASEEDIAAFIDEQDGAADFSDVQGGASARDPRGVLGKARDWVARPALQGASLGGSDEIRGGLAAGLTATLGDDVELGQAERRGQLRSQQDAEKVYLQHRDAERAARDRARDEAPLLSGASELAGGFLTPTGAVGGTARAVSTGGKIAKGAKLGTLMGALAGWGYQRGDDGTLARPRDLLEPVAKGAMYGGAVGGAIPGAIGTARGAIKVGKAARNIYRNVRTNPELQGIGADLAEGALQAASPRMAGLVRAGRAIGRLAQDAGPPPPTKPTAASAKAGLRQLGETLREAKGVPPDYRGLPPRPPKAVSGRDWDLTPGPRLDFTDAAPPPRPAPGPLRATEGAAPPRADALVSDDPLMQAMAAQVARGTPPTPRVSQARGFAPSAPPTARPRPKGGKGTREGIDASARAIGLDPDAIRAKVAGNAERGDYGRFMTKHSQGSAQRRGQLEYDARVNADATAKMDALQQQADEAPTEGVRDALYREWRKLKNEYGRIGPTGKPIPSNPVQHPDEFARGWVGPDGSMYSIPKNAAGIFTDKYTHAAVAKEMGTSVDELYGGGFVRATRLGLKENDGIFLDIAGKPLTRRQIASIIDLAPKRGSFPVSVDHQTAERGVRYFEPKNRAELREFLEQWLDPSASNEYGRIGPIYHGSPHKFDKFDSSKIGTGEGAQAYGHGLYFAESPSVAKSYRAKLATQGPAQVRVNGGEPIDFPTLLRQPDLTPVERDILTKLAQDSEATAGQIKKALEGRGRWYESLTTGGLEWAAPYRDAARALATRVDDVNGGATYTVELPHATPDDFLHWDKPLSEQPETVQRALRSLLPEDQLADDELGSQVYRKLARGDARDANKVLRPAGIKGVRYLDGSSRRAGEGSYNYVVFDDADINILSREGKAALKMMAGTGAAAGGALTAAALADRRK